MKRLLAALLSTLMLLSMSLAFAEGIDLSAMTDDELQALIVDAQNELSSRKTAAPDKQNVIMDQEGVIVYLTGNYKIDEYTPYLHLEAVLENNSGRTVDMFMESASINGWVVDCTGIPGTPSGKKQKMNIDLYLGDAGISSIEEIENIELDMYMYDSVTYERIGEVVPAILQF